MKRLWLAVTIATATGWAADLAPRLDPLTAPSPQTGFAGIHVVEASSGKVLYEANADRLYLPASNFKILTSALALERLGADYHYTTKVLREVSGDVVLVGSGDPSLSGRAYPYDKSARPGPPLAAIEELAAQVAARGVTRIDGDIVGDDRLYPWVPFPPSWTIDDTVRDFGAPVSALTLNDNLVTVTLSAGARVGDPAVAAVFPALEYLTLDNRVLTSARGGEANIHVQRVPGSRQWVLTGSLPLGKAAAEILPVDDPALFAASALYDALIRRGIAIHGRPVARHRLPGEEVPLQSGEELALRTSPPLGDLLQVMDKLSQNLHAELILREVGRVRRREGTTEAGLADLNAYLTEIGATPGDWRVEDGSGLSRNALVTPRLLTLILARLSQSKDATRWLALLPAGGEDGTLDHRLCCMSDGRGIRAKTGTLARAIALSGYADSKSQGLVAFSILVNDFSGRASQVREWIDKIAIELLN